MKNPKTFIGAGRRWRIVYTSPDFERAANAKLDYTSPTRRTRLAKLSNGRYAVGVIKK